MSEARASRGLTTLSACCAIAGALGWAWAFFAAQTPSSPWSVPGFPLMVERFATHAWITAFAIHVFRPRELPAPRALSILATLGSVLSLGALAASGATGLLGVQIRDPRAGAQWVLGARVLGGLCLCAALALALHVRWLEHRRG